MYKELQIELGRFGRAVVKQARTNLTTVKKEDTKALYNSLDYDLDVHKNSFSLSFEMLDYGMFVDQGVKGANPSLVKGGKQKGGRSPFAFKNKRPPLKPILNWVKHKGLRMRSKNGQFAKGSQKTLAFLISRSIYQKGIKPSLFFTKPFNAAFERLPDELIVQFGLDVNEFLEESLKNKF